MSEHASSSKTYVWVLLVLLVLTGVTTSVAFIDLGRLNAVVALAIAVTKALLVVLFFMHVRYSTKLTKIVVAGGVFWLAILISMTMGDLLTRGWLPYPGK